MTISSQYPKKLMRFWIEFLLSKNNVLLHMQHSTTLDKKEFLGQHADPMKTHDPKWFCPLKIRQ